MTRRISIVVGFFLFAITFYLDSSTGYRYPYSDDWDIIPMLTGSAPITWKWLWAQHNEHRIVLPKLIYLASFKFLPDFRSPSLVMLSAMGVCSLILIQTARKLQGVNPLLLLVFPMLILNMTLGYHHWGFHLQFGSGTFLLCLLLAMIVYVQVSDTPSYQGVYALVISVALISLPLCGMNGVLPSFVLAPYFAVRGWRQIAFGERTNYIKLWGSVLAAASFVACLITGLVFVGYRSIPHPWGKPTPHQFVDATLHVLSAPLSFGKAGLVAGIAIAFLLVFIAVHLIGQIRTKDNYANEIDWRTVDLLAFIVAISLLALGLGWGRGGRGWEPGLDSHYSLLMVPLLAALFVVMIVNRWTKSVLGVFCITSLMFCLHGYAAVRNIPYAGERFRKIDRTIAEGASVDLLVARHVNDFFFVDNEHARKVVRRGLLELKNYYIQKGYTDRYASILE